MTNVASKNPYDLLGNDPELDPDREPEPPTKVIDKPGPRTGKRNVAAEGPTSGTQRALGGGRGGGGDQAGSLNSRPERREDGPRQDRGSNRNREPREPRGGGDRGRARGERGGERGGRGFSGRFQRTNRDDRSDHTGIGTHEKQAAQGWGDEKSGTAEWNDEKAGEDIARAESKDEPGFTPDTTAGDPAFTNGPGAPGEVVDEDAAGEPEEKTKSYDEYLAEQAEKRLALGNESLQVRKANEGSKQKFPEGTVASRNPEEENFFKGSGGKAKREKANQQAKQTVQLDGQYYAATDSGDRGGPRGRGRGGRGGGRGEFRGDRGDRGDRGGRGEFRGDRADRGERGERGGRGEFRGDRGERGEHRGRGGRGRGERGEFRGAPRGDRGDRGDRSDRGGSRGGFNATDSSAFPALGGS